MRSLRAGFWVFAPAVGALAGLLYAALFGVEFIVSAIRGACIASPVLLYERGLFIRGWRDLTRRAATPLFALATIATYVVMIVIGNAGAGTVLHHGFGYMPNARTAMMMSESGFAYALLVSALASFVFRIRDLIGPRLFASLLLGRYHRPVTEERIFLFLDVAGSTRFAEQHGDLAAQRFLGTFFSALARPVRHWRGSIDDYIGDMALISWTVAQGTRDAACLRCVFDFEAAIAAEAERWIAQFGQAPRFRAALHCGSVVTAEIGLERHKIAYFGDTVNTTSRLEALAKELDTAVLVSGDLLTRIGSLPVDLVAEPLGPRAIRGRDQHLEVAAIRRAAQHPNGTNVIEGEWSKATGFRQAARR